MNASINANELSVVYGGHDRSSANIRSYIINLIRNNSNTSEESSSYSEVRALDGINVQITEGERVGLIGVNGSGKTTLLKVLAGVLYPTGGSLNIEGKVNSIFDPALGMDPEASGYENITIRCMFLGLSKAEIAIKKKEIADFSELGNALNRPIKTYSAGMSMRLAFSIATSVEPEILIMDEWLSAGDARFVNKALEKMKSLVLASRILVLASHSENVLTEWCNRVIWIDSGKIRADGDPSDTLKLYREYAEAN